MITEYTAVEFKGIHLDEKTPWQFWVIQLGENLYYQTYDKDGIRITDNIVYAARFAKEQFVLETIGFLQNFYDKEGKPRYENIEKIIPPIIGLSEAAEILGWDKRKVSTYIKRGVFPKPFRQLASGPIWFYKQIEDYKNNLVIKK